MWQQHYNQPGFNNPIPNVPTWPVMPPPPNPAGTVFETKNYNHGHATGGTYLAQHSTSPEQVRKENQGYVQQVYPAEQSQWMVQRERARSGEQGSWMGHGNPPIVEAKQPGWVGHQQPQTATPEHALLGQNQSSQVRDRQKSGSNLSWTEDKPVKEDNTWSEKKEDKWMGRNDTARNISGGSVDTGSKIPTISSQDSGWVADSTPAQTDAHYDGSFQKAEPESSYSPAKFSDKFTKTYSDFINKQKELLQTNRVTELEPVIPYSPVKDKLVGSGQPTPGKQASKSLVHLFKDEDNPFYKGPEIQCEVCCIPFMDQQGYQRHCSGVLHQRRLQKQNTALSEPVSSGFSETSECHISPPDNQWDEEKKHSGFTQSSSVSSSTSAQPQSPGDCTEPQPIQDDQQKMPVWLHECKLCDLRHSNSMSFLEHCRSYRHRKTYLQEKTAMGDEEFTNKYGDCMYFNLEEDQASEAAGLGPSMLFIYQSGVLNKFRCRLCQSKSTSSTSWREHCLSAGHSQRVREEQSQMDYKKYIQQYGDLPGMAREEDFGRKKSGQESKIQSQTLEEQIQKAKEAEYNKWVNMDPVEFKAQILSGALAGLKKDALTASGNLTKDPSFQSKEKEISKTSEKVQKDGFVEGESAVCLDYHHGVSPRGDKSSDNKDAKRETRPSEEKRRSKRSTDEQKVLRSRNETSSDQEKSRRRERSEQEFQGRKSRGQQKERVSTDAAFDKKKGTSHYRETGAYKDIDERKDFDRGGATDFDNSIRYSEMNRRVATGDVQERQGLREKLFTDRDVDERTESRRQSDRFPTDRDVDERYYSKRQREKTRTERDIVQMDGEKKSSNYCRERGVADRASGSVKPSGKNREKAPSATADRDFYTAESSKDQPDQEANQRKRRPTDKHYSASGSDEFPQMNVADENQPRSRRLTPIGTNSKGDSRSEVRYPNLEKKYEKRDLREQLSRRAFERAKKSNSADQREGNGSEYIEHWDEGTSHQTTYLDMADTHRRSPYYEDVDDFDDGNHSSKAEFGLAQEHVDRMHAEEAYESKSDRASYISEGREEGIFTADIRKERDRRSWRKGHRDRGGSGNRSDHASEASYREQDKRKMEYRSDRARPRDEYWEGEQAQSGDVRRVVDVHHNADLYYDSQDTAAEDDCYEKNIAEMISDVRKESNCNENEENEAGYSGRDKHRKLSAKHQDKAFRPESSGVEDRSSERHWQEDDYREDRDWPMGSSRDGASDEGRRTKGYFQDEKRYRRESKRNFEIADRNKDWSTGRRQYAPHKHTSRRPHESSHSQEEEYVDEEMAIDKALLMFIKTLHNCIEELLDDDEDGASGNYRSDEELLSDLPTEECVQINHFKEMTGIRSTAKVLRLLEMVKNVDPRVLQLLPSRDARELLSQVTHTETTQAGTIMLQLVSMLQEAPHLAGNSNSSHNLQEETAYEDNQDYPAYHNRRDQADENYDDDGYWDRNAGENAEWRSDSGRMRRSSFYPRPRKRMTEQDDWGSEKRFRHA